MKISARSILNKLMEEYPQLQCCSNSVETAFQVLHECYLHEGKLLICGNGGSASDSEHIVGELMKGFLMRRKVSEEIAEKFKNTFPDDGEYLSEHLQGALPAISLVSQSAISSAFINDVAADMVYAQQVYGYGKEGDVLVGLSTSGNSKNVINAFKVAKVLGVKTIGMTGENGGLTNDLCDVIIKVPSKYTYKIQEYHLPIYHALCAMLECEFFME